MNIKSVLPLLIAACFGCSAGDSSTSNMESQTNVVSQAISNPFSQNWSGFCFGGLCMGSIVEHGRGPQANDIIMLDNPTSAGTSSFSYMNWVFYHQIGNNPFTIHQELTLANAPSLCLGVASDHRAILVNCDHQLYGAGDVAAQWGVMYHWQTGLCLDQGGPPPLSHSPLYWRTCAANGTINPSQFWNGVGYITMGSTFQQTYNCSNGYNVPYYMDTGPFCCQYGTTTGITYPVAAPALCQAPGSDGTYQPTAHEAGFLIFIDLAAPQYYNISHTDYGSYSSGVNQLLTNMNGVPEFAATITAGNVDQDWRFFRETYASGTDEELNTPSAPNPWYQLTWSSYSNPYGQHLLYLSAYNVSSDNQILFFAYVSP